MKIALLILFIGASNALPAPQFLDFGEMNRQIAQQVAGINQQVQEQIAGVNQQVQEEIANVNQQVQEQITYAQNQANEARKQAIEAGEKARQLGLQNQGNTQFLVDNKDYSSVNIQQSIQNGVRICSGTRFNRVTGQWESFTC